MAVPMNSSSFRATVAPILNETFDGIYDQRTDEWKQVFKESTGIARAYHEEPVLFGFSIAPELPDGMPVTYDAGGTLYIQRYLYKVYGLAFALTKVLVEDGDHIQIGQTYAEHLAASLIETKETLASTIMNRAFNGTYTGGDGVSLISPSHPVVNGTQSNQLTTAAALSQTSLEQMLIQVRNGADSNGKRMRFIPKQLVVGSSNEFQGEVLTKSVLRAGTANNDINPIKSMGLLNKGVAVMSRITSTTAWWVQVDGVPKGLQLKMRRKLEKSMEGDFETDSMRYKSTERYRFGWTDWRDIWGTPGL